MNDLLWPIIVGIVAGFLAGKVMKGKGFGLILTYWLVLAVPFWAAGFSVNLELVLALALSVL